MAININLTNIDFTVSNITFVNGMTLDRCKMKYNWLLNAKVDNAIIGEDKNGLVWYTGDWICGTWYNGTWYSGTWYNGVWKNGTWYSCLLNKFDILNDKLTIIENNFTSSEFLNGIWENGTWYGGTFGYQQNLFTQTINVSGSTIANKYEYFTEKWEFESNSGYSGKVGFYNNTTNTPSYISVGNKIRIQQYSGTYTVYNTIATITEINNSTLITDIDYSGTTSLETGYILPYLTNDYDYLTDDIIFDKINLKSYDITTSSVTYSTFDVATWLSGTYNDGLFYSAIWKSGVFNKGTIMDSVWTSGSFVSGSFIGYLWLNGTFLSGDFDLGVWYNGTFNEISKTQTTFVQSSSVKTFSPILKPNISSVVSRFGTAINTNTFYFGENYGYIKSIWHNGVFKKGQFHSILNTDGTTTFSSKKHNYSIWEYGLWENGWWYGGHFKLGTWERGIWYDGIFGTTTDIAIWNIGTWYCGLFQNAIWYDGTLYSGVIDNNSTIHNVSIGVEKKNFYHV